MYYYVIAGVFSAVHALLLIDLLPERSASSWGIAYGALMTLFGVIDYFYIKVGASPAEVFIPWFGFLVGGMIIFRVILAINERRHRT